MTLTFIQDVAPAEPPVEKISETLSYFSLALKGGWPMVPLLLLLIMALYIFFDRYFLLKKAVKVDPAFIQQIKGLIQQGMIEQALTLCASKNTPYARMVEAGIRRIGRPLNDVSTAIENVGNLEISKLEKGLSIVAMVSGGAPMIGFLGTVLGMIQAFFNMAQQGNNVVISVLASGIYQALVTTVAGLIVGLIGYFAYNYLVSRIEKAIYELEAVTTEFMDLLNSPSR